MNLLGLGRKQVAVKTEEEALKDIASEETTLVCESLRDAAEPFISLLHEIRVFLKDPQPIKSEQEKLWNMEETLTLVVKAFQAGFSPTTPNKKWYCGMINDKFLYGFNIIDGNRRLMSKLTEVNPKRNGDVVMLVFTGIIPVKAQEKIVAATKIFGESRIFISSPNLSDFQVPEVHLDPVALALIPKVPEHGDLFFEIARWDTKKDLKAMPEEIQ